jgi:hypothetical protein
MRRLVKLLMLAPLLGAAGPPRADAGAAPSRQSGTIAPAIVGSWRLNVRRTRYGPGVDRRRWERFACVARGMRIECTIRGARADGRVVRGSFAATVDGAGGNVAGIDGADEVRLRAGGPGVLDATFLLRGAPAYAYRAFRADDGRSLTIVTVDPSSRAALSTVVVYDHE